MQYRSVLRKWNSGYFCYIELSSIFFNVIRQKSLILYRFVMKLLLIHISESKKLEIYQVIGLMDLSMQSPCIELSMRFKKIKLFQYCYVEHITIFMNSWKNNLVIWGCSWEGRFLFYELAENTRYFSLVDESTDIY